MVRSYRKIPKIGPTAWLIFLGAYLRRAICVSKSIGLALELEVNLPFLLCPPPPGELYLEGRFNGGFFCVTG